MVDKNININELSSIELMKVIYKEILETNKVVNKNSEEIIKLNNTVDEMKKDIKDMDQKIESEEKERKVDISRIEGNNDFERIVLSDFGTRLTILEEEGEKYSTN